MAGRDAPVLVPGQDPGRSRPTRSLGRPLLPDGPRPAPATGRAAGGWPGGPRHSAVAAVAAAGQFDGYGTCTGPRMDNMRPGKEDVYLWCICSRRCTRHVPPRRDAAALADEGEGKRRTRARQAKRGAGAEGARPRGRQDQAGAAGGGAARVPAYSHSSIALIPFLSLPSCGWRCRPPSLASAPIHGNVSSNTW